jgi:hypothetical protein
MPYWIIFLGGFPCGAVWMVMAIAALAAVRISRDEGPSEDWFRGTESTPKQDTPGRTRCGSVGSVRNGSPALCTSTRPVSIRAHCAGATVSASKRCAAGHGNTTA